MEPIRPIGPRPDLEPVRPAVLSPREREERRREREERRRRALGRRRSRPRTTIRRGSTCASERPLVRTSAPAKIRIQVSAPGADHCGCKGSDMESLRLNT